MNDMCPNMTRRHLAYVRVPTQLHAHFFLSFLSRKRLQPEAVFATRRFIIRAVGDDAAAAAGDANGDGELLQGGDDPGGLAPEHGAGALLARAHAA